MRYYLRLQLTVAMRVSVCVPVTMGTACSSAAVGSANEEIREPQEMAAEDVDFDENGPVILDLVSFCNIYFFLF